MKNSNFLEIILYYFSAAQNSVFSVLWRNLVGVEGGVWRWGNNQICYKNLAPPYNPEMACTLFLLLTC